MFRLHLLHVATASVLLRTTYAAYTQVHFSSEKAGWTCPDFGLDCKPPGICAFDDLIDKFYCLDAGAGSVAWGFSTDCAGGNETTPSSSQIGCDSGVDAFCCLKTREECTQHVGQINICWADQTYQPNPWAEVSQEKSNATFSSLSSASPAASTFPVDIEKLLASSTSSSSSSSATSTTTSSAPTSSSVSNSGTLSSSTTSPSPTNNSDSGLSGGAIAGIVVGAIAGLALIGAGAFLLFRRKRKIDHGNELDSNPYSPGGYGVVASSEPQEKYAHNAAHEAAVPSQYSPAEMQGDTTYHPAEVEGSHPPVNSTSPVPGRAEIAGK